MNINAKQSKDDQIVDATEDHNNDHTLQEKMHMLSEKNVEYLDGWQRARADYQNLQRECEKRLADVQHYATEAFILELLPLIDHFYYAFQHIPAEERQSSWVQGIEHIQKNFLKILEQHGVSMLETVGKKFDPNFHESVEMIEGDHARSGMICEEVSAGFTFHGKLIKTAKVKIIK